MNRAALVSAAVATTLLALSAVVAAPVAQTAAGALKSARDFAGVSDRKQRSVALFTEAAKVITHPRCMNCHPAGDRPLQGDDSHLHVPPAVRGASNVGAPGMQCPTCHQERNVPIMTSSIASVPGNPAWALAPLDMAWVGKSLPEICAQLKDRARNGGRSLEKLHEHMAHDELVGWGWAPGAGRTPAPGTQQRFGELIRDWIDTGAACPG